jgi:ribosomal protein L29
MKIAEVVQKSDKELVTLLAEQQAKLAELRVDYRIKQVSNIKELAAVRKTIARIKTIMRERAITAAEAEDKETK